MNWQISMLQFLGNIRNPLLNKVFEIITISTESIILLLVTSITYWCFNKKLGQKLGFVLLLSMTGNGFIKNLVKAPRPFELGVVEPLRRHTATGYSFPSGHIQAATTFWGMWMVYINKKCLYYIGSIIIALIGLSRIYLGAHWPIDVMVGISFGIIFIIIGEYIFKKLSSLEVKILLLGGALLFSTVFLKFDADYIKTIGGMIGFIIGYLLERRYIDFSTEGSLYIQIKKIVIGIIGLGVIYGGLKLLLPNHLFFSFIRYGCVTMWIVAGGPYVFNRIFTSCR